MLYRGDLSTFGAIYSHSFTGKMPVPGRVPVNPQGGNVRKKLLICQTVRVPAVLSLNFRSDDALTFVVCEPGTCYYFSGALACCTT